MTTILVPAADSSPNELTELTEVFSLDLGLNIIDKPLESLIGTIKGNLDYYISFMNDTNSNQILASIAKGSRPIAFAGFQEDFLINTYKQPKSFLDKSITLADSGEIKPDPEYFTESRDALGVTYSEELDQYILPEANLTELILSYLLIAKGLVNIYNHELESLICGSLFTQFIFLGDMNNKNDEKCWIEEYVVLTD
jgi:hypothetical protein